MKEIWKDIPEYEELYQISNLGRVRSKDRLIKVNCQNNSHVKRPFFYYVYPGRIIKLQTNKFGYTTVFLNKGGKQKGFFVHRLVIKTFNPILNDSDYQVNHIDENKESNSLNNLEWCTAKENINHGTCIQRRVEKQKITNRRRKPVISIDESGNEKEYLSAWDASRKIGAFQSNIWKAIHNGKKCNGYYWKYKEE